MFKLISSNPEESSGFRSMYLTKDTIDSIKNMNDNNFQWIELLAIYMLEQDFAGTGSITEEALKLTEQKKSIYKTVSPKGYDQLFHAYRSVLADIIYFPVAASRLDETINLSYENSWMFERNYGGSRGHEGTDLIPSVKKNDYYPIVSMTDGIVEQVGWLDKGGYRIGIRSTHGGYFYYAHLSSYGREFQKGDLVTAGEILGYMGSSGYGPEGTTNMFDTHLHIGIYIQTEHYSELSVNPYWILKYIEDEQMYYNF